MSEKMNEIDLKPLNILSAILLYDYYLHHAQKDEGGETIDQKNSFLYQFQSRWYGEIDNALKQLFQDFTENKDDKSLMLFNAGKILLLSLYSRYYEASMSKWVLNFSRGGKVYPDDSLLIEKGILSGFAADYNKAAEEVISNYLTSIDPPNEDGPTTTVRVLPTIEVGHFFEDGEFCCNRAEILGIILNSAYYTLSGFFSAHLGANTIDFFQANKNSSGDTIISKLNSEYGVGDDKFYSFGQLAMIFDTIIDFVQKGIGQEFDDVFTKVFRSVGKVMRDIFNKRVQESADNEEFLESLLLNPDFEHPYDRAFAYLLNITSLSSAMSIGSKVVDLRKIYSRSLLFGKDYKPPFRAETYIEFSEANGRIWNLQNTYRTVIDPCAYELLLRKYIADRAVLKKTGENSKYVILWYQVHYMGNLIERIYKFWHLGNGPLKIVHVEDVYERNQLDRYIIKDINTIDYRDAFAKVQEILSSLNMRFFEAIRSEMDGNSEAFKAVHQLTEKVPIKNFTPADIIPQLFIGDGVKGHVYGFRTIDGMGKIENNMPVFESEDLNVGKLSKLNILDTGTDPENSHILPRPVYDVVSTKSFNSSVVEGEGGRDTAASLANILRNLYSNEYLHLIR